MAEIPYYFETPIPKYFREAGWFANPNTILFVTWAFSKCSTQPHKTVMDGKEVTLAPYEFIAGRLTSPKECHLSEEAWRHQLNTQLKAGLLKKTPNSAPNRFTCYIWVTERFSKINPQLNPQPTPNSPPTEPPQSRRKKKEDISNKDHPPLPPSKVLAFEAEGLIDDSFQEIFSHTFEVNKKIVTVEMPKPIFQECVQIKGSEVLAIQAIEYISRSPGRKKEIQNWPNAMLTWTIKSTIKPRAAENEAQGKRLEKQHAENPGWRCQVYRDTIKDQKGLLFYNNCSNGSGGTIFVSFIDPEFKEKVVNALREKKMMKALIPKS